jgi:acyl carrier protein
MTVGPAPTVTFETIAARLGTRLSVPPGGLTPRTALADLAADSLDLVEILIDLQEEFGVSLTQADLRTVLTLGDLVALLGTQSDAAPH